MLMILCETMLLFFVYFLNFILQLISSKNNGFQIVQKKMIKQKIKVINGRINYVQKLHVSVLQIWQ